MKINKNIIIYTLILVLVISIIPILSNGQKKTYSVVTQKCKNPDYHLTSGHCCPDGYTYNNFKGLYIGCFNESVNFDDIREVTPNGQCKSADGSTLAIDCYKAGETPEEVELGICESLDNNYDNTACHKGGGICLDSKTCKCDEDEGQEWNDSEQKCVTITDEQPSGNHLECDAGTYANGNECTQCPENHYCPGGLESKKQCNPGEVSEPGSKSINDCKSAVPTSCPAGQYLNNRICEQCPANNYCPKDNLDKVNCPQNSTSTAGSGSIIDCKCVAGTYLGPNNTCDSCPTGYTSQPGSQTVEDCNIPITKCAINEYYDSISKSCKSCPINSTSVAGSNSITSCKCTTGYRLNNGVCILDCAAGTYANGNTCTQCPANHYCPGNRAELDGRKYECPTNSTSQSGSKSIEDCTCNIGYTWNSAALKCMSNNNSSSSKNNNNSSSSKNNNNNNNPQTGSPITVVLLIGITGIGYTLWYYNKMNKNKV